MNHTAYDVMREYMIEGAELDGPYQFPMMPRYTGRPGTDTVDFKDSFDRRIKNHRDLTVNFYIHDEEVEEIREMIQTEKPLPDWGVAKYNGGTYFIAYVL